MKKKLLIGTILPALAAAAVIGSGFAYWVFTDLTTGDIAQGNISKEVTQLVTIGNIETADGFSFIFDQENRTTSLNLGNGEGIHLGEWKGDNHKAVYTSPNSANGYLDIVDGKTMLEFTTTITITGNAKNYVNTISYNGSAFIKNDGEFVYKFYVRTATAAKEFNWDNVTFTYIQEPTNKSEYDALKTAVDNSTFAVKYNATIINYTAE